MGVSADDEGSLVAETLSTEGVEPLYPLLNIDFDPEFGGLTLVEYSEVADSRSELAAPLPPDPGIDAGFVPPPPMDDELLLPDLVKEEVAQPLPLASEVQEVIEEVEPPSWLNQFADNHVYLWHENRDSLEILIRDSGGFGITSLGLASAEMEWGGPIWANFKFNWNFLSGPVQAEVRPQTYDLTFELNYAEQIDEIWGLHFQLAPTWATDWDNKTSDAFRLIGGGLVTMTVDEGVVWLLGAMALDRPDLEFVPTFGLRLFDDEFEMDLVIPRPRIAWRTDSDDEDGEECWMYVAGELGGGSWAIERENHLKDRLGYRDLRLLFGWETKEPDGSREVFEFGWVFDRKIEFDRYGGSTRLGETAVIRWGQTY